MNYYNAFDTTLFSEKIDVKGLYRAYGGYNWWFSAFWDQFEVVDNLTKDL